MGVRTAVLGVLCISAFTNLGVTAQVANSNLTNADFPVCSIQCLLTGIPISGCEITDTTCLCKNKDLAHTISKCVLANCTMDEMVTTSKIQASMCDLPHESRSHEVFLYTVISYAVTIVFVGLRFWGKIVTQRLALADWICLGGLLVQALPFGCIMKMQSLGFGKHVWGLDDGRQIRNISLYFWIAATTYIIILCAIKTSLILLYIEIFPKKRTQTVAYMILIFIITSGLGIYLSSIFACRPVQGAWDLDLHAKCIDNWAMGYVISGFSIVQDLLLLVFPLTCIWSLNMSRRRKYAVGFMFCVGTFGCITTLLRLHTLLKFKRTIDPTWDYVDLTNWTTLELLSGFVCISIPSVRMFLIHYLPKGLITSISNSSKNTPTPRVASNPREKEGKRDEWWDHCDTHNLERCASTLRFETHITATPTQRPWPGSFATRPKPSSKSKSKSRSRSRSQQRLRDSFTIHPEISLTHIQTETPIVPESRMASTIAPRFPSTIPTQDDAMELKPLRRSRQPSHSQEYTSCGSQVEILTALPRVGCLPDESFQTDDEEESRSRKSRRAGWDTATL